MASLSRPHKQFINGRQRASASGYFIKDSAAPMATLSTNGNFIKPSPNGYQCRLQPAGPTPRSGSRRPNLLLRRTSSLSTAGWPRFRSRPAPMASLSRPHKQFINGRPRASASGYFIKDSAAPMATLSTNGHFIKPMAALSRKPRPPPPGL